MEQVQNFLAASWENRSDPLAWDMFKRSIEILETMLPAAEVAAMMDKATGRSF